MMLDMGYIKVVLKMNSISNKDKKKNLLINFYYRRVKLS